MSGASGTPFAASVLRGLLAAGESVDLVVSRASRLTLLDETGIAFRDAHWQEDLRVRSHGEGGSKLYPAFGGDPAFARQVCATGSRGGRTAHRTPSPWAGRISLAYGTGRPGIWRQGRRRGRIRRGGC